ASAQGQLVKLDAKTGKEEWRISTGENLSAGVGIGSNLVLVGTSTGYLVAYDQQGKLLWKSKLSSEILSAPRVNGDVVIVRAGDGRIFGLSAIDGARV